MKITFPFSTGIGVPIMLAYVYGVVPVSLCRSGGCGVTTGNSGGVRIELDEENEVGLAGADNQSGELFVSSLISAFSDLMFRDIFAVSGQI